MTGLDLLVHFSNVSADNPARKPNSLKLFRVKIPELRYFRVPLECSVCHSTVLFLDPPDIIIKHHVPVPIEADRTSWQFRKEIGL